MSHFNPISTKFAFRHRRRKRSRFLPSHDTRTRTRTRTHTHTRAHIKACGRHLLVIHNAGTYTLLHVVSYVFSPLERRFTLTPILHQPLTFVLPFYNPQRRVFQNKISFALYQQSWFRFCVSLHIGAVTRIFRRDVEEEETPEPDGRPQR